MRNKTQSGYSSSFLLVIGVLSAATFLAFISLSSGSSTHKAVNHRDHTAVLSAHTGLYQLNINKVITISSDIKNKTKRVTTEVQLKNLSGSTLQISPGLQMFLVDQNGSRYNVTAKFLAPGVNIGGPLATNASRTQGIDFEIPTNSTPQKFIFQLDSSAAITSISL
jgi:hypothetical protein